jgi:hypothetical protein
LGTAAFVILPGASLNSLAEPNPPTTVLTNCPLLATARAGGKLEISGAGNDNPPAAAALVTAFTVEGGNSVPLSLAAVDFARN